MWLPTPAPKLGNTALDMRPSHFLPAGQQAKENVRENPLHLKQWLPSPPYPLGLSGFFLWAQCWAHSKLSGKWCHRNLPAMTGPLDGGLPDIASLSSSQSSPLWKDFPNRFFHPLTVFQSWVSQHAALERMLITSIKWHGDFHCWLALGQVEAGTACGWVLVSPLWPAFTQVPLSNSSYRVKKGTHTIYFYFYPSACGLSDSSLIWNGFKYM